jgi:hypothetical protein
MRNPLMDEFKGQDARHFSSRVERPTDPVSGGHLGLHSASSAWMADPSQPSQNGLFSLPAGVLDALRRTDAARPIEPSLTASSLGTPSMDGSKQSVGSRSLRWTCPSDSVLDLLGRHIADLAVIAAAKHRLRVASSLRDSTRAGASR